MSSKNKTVSEVISLTIRNHRERMATSGNVWFWKDGRGKPTGDGDKHCKHGRHVGSVYGPDYLCGWCEDGMSDVEYELRNKIKVLEEIAETYEDLVIKLAAHVEDLDTPMSCSTLRHMWYS